MGKIIFFVILISVVLIYPLFVVKNTHYIKESVSEKNISLVTINNGTFFKYDNNLSKSGRFLTLDIYKNFYFAKNLLLKDLIKKEFFKANRAKFIFNKLYCYDFFYHNNEYNFSSDFVIYNTKNKLFKGEKFLLISQNFKGKGKNFKVDENRNIKANEIIFDLKVSK